MRFYNALCIAYGSDVVLRSTTFSDFIQQKLLPESRRVRCATEFMQTKKAFDRLILPHVNADAMKKVQATDWLKPEDGIDALPPNNDKANSVYYYYRGICEERSKQWPKAEADLRKALELQPEQPHVLNYLGYSWIDQGLNLDEGMRMIRRAVEQRSDDGYIVDSLGWAYYRVGNYEDAVKNLERAVELKPEDPTINDHLGDAYWRVGRTLEARFQWAHARDLKPEPDDLAKIEQKIKVGLTDDAPAPSAEAEKKKPEGGG